MKDYEKAFIAKTERLSRSGLSIGELAREALSAKFGGASEVLLRDLSQDAMADPTRFTQEMSKVFGRGAMAFFEPIEKYVDLGLYTTVGSSPVLDMIRQIASSPGEDQTRKEVFLHEHRIMDEEGNFPDNAN